MELQTDIEEMRKVFGECVKRKRVDLNLTQTDLARLVWPEVIGDPDEINKLNTKRKCISGYEKGIFPRDTMDMIRLCDALGCDMGYLFGEHECSTKDLQGVVDFTGLSENDVESLVDLRNHGEPITGAVHGFLHDLLSSFYLVPLAIAYKRRKEGYYNSSSYAVTSDDGKDVHFFDGDVGTLLLNQAFADFANNTGGGFIRKLKEEQKKHTAEIIAEAMRGK